MGRADPAERLRLITETIGEVFWMATFDLARMIYVSPAYERIWQRSCESLYEDPRSFLEVIHPDDLERVLRELQVERDGLPFDHEYRIVRGDGSVRWIWDRGYPVRDDDGRVDRYVGVAQDVTERKTAEFELAALADRFHLVSSATRDGIWDWDMIANTAWWSEAFYDAFGYDRATEPSYEAWLERIHPEDRARVRDGFAKAIDGCVHGWSDEYRLRMADGSVRYVFDRAHVLYDASGRPVRMVGAMMDVTARRSLESQLRHAQKMEAIGQLAGGVAHDFNNIVQSMLLQIELAQAGALGDAQATLLDDLKASAERAARLTRQLLLFSRREAMQSRWVDLNAVVLELARLLGRVLREDITLELDLAPEALWVHGDPGMLDQVLLNLGVNAQDAMPGGGTMSITTARVDVAAGGVRRTGPHARISVVDDGVGIPRDVLARVFEPFFTTKEPGRGTGLGLATAYGIVEQHRGWIEVESEVGRGSAFTVFLPIGEPPGMVASDAPSVAFAPVRGETVLVVEDDDALRAVLRQLLEQQGYRVLAADHAAAALDAWERADGLVDLVLTDVVMPGGIDGWRLAAQLEARRPGQKILIATGYSSDLAQRALAPQQRLLQKPITPEALLRAVRALLDAA